MTEKENSKLYRLQEMYDSMSQSIENATKIVNEQKSLLDFIKQHDANDQFNSFLNDLNNGIIALTNQIDKLTERKNSLNKVIIATNNSKNIANVIETTLDAFGIFEA